MRTKGKAIMSILLMGAMLFSVPKTVNAQDVTGEIVTDSLGQKYEYVITSWNIDQEPEDGVKVENPRQCGDALTPGTERQVTINTTYSVTTEISAEASAKLTSGLSIGTDLIKASVQREFNYKISGKRTNYYSQSITKAEKITFSTEMAAQGYNTCVPYTGVVYNTNNVTVDIYKVKQYSHRHWFLGKKHTHTERGAYVKTVTIQAKQPVIVTFLKYMKVSLKSSPVNVILNSNDTVIISKKQ